MKNNNYSSILQSFFFYVLIFVTICFLFFKINIELKQEINPSTSIAIQKEKIFFHYLKTYSNRIF